MKTTCNCGHTFEYTADKIENAHRVLAGGDSTKTKDIKKLMNGKLADLAIFDPPFNVNYEGTKFEKILNDNMAEEKFIEFSMNFIARMKESLKTGGTFYICSGYSSFVPFLYAIKANGLEFSTPIIWVNNNTSLGWGDYRHKNEMILKGKNKGKKAVPILYGWNGGKHYFPDTRFEADVWEIKRRAGNTMVHPNQKPLELVSRAIKNSSKREQIVLDLFAGSFSVLISAERENRIAYSNELDLKYVSVGLDRWSAFTKKDPLRLSDNKTWSEIKQGD